MSPLLKAISKIGNGKISKEKIDSLIENTMKDVKELEETVLNDSIRLDRLIREIKQNTRPPSL